MPKYIGQVKGASAFAFNKEHKAEHHLKWQDGYGTLSLRRSDTEDVIVYIEEQEAVHAKRRKFSALLERIAPLLQR